MYYMKLKWLFCGSGNDFRVGRVFILIHLCRIPEVVALLFHRLAK